MKNKILFLTLIVIIIFTGCVTWEEKALMNGYIKAEECPEIEIPERVALPHPLTPQFETEVDIDETYLMYMVVDLFGTVEKFKFLVEIYEREYLNAGGKILPDLTLEELKQKYYDRIKSIQEILKPTEEITLEATASIITVDEFRLLVKAWNSIIEE